LVLAVEPDSPAQRAGLQEGDVIVGVMGEAIEGVDVLHRVLGEERINAWTDLVVLRGTQKLSLKALPEVRGS